MIKVFTLDPSSLSSIEDFGEILRLFGIQNLRIIWKYPSNWNTLIKENIRSRFKSKERKKAFNKLEKMDDFLIELPAGLVGNENDINKDNWLNYAVELKRVYEYDGIISNKNPHSENFICSIENLEVWENFNNIECFRIKRDAEVMSKGVDPLLYSANVIHFVDPYFQNTNERHLRPLREFLKVIFTNLRVNKNVSIYYHTGDSSRELNIRHNLNPILSEYLLDGASFKIVRWPDDSLHNRFILTDNGGVGFHIGLDDSEFENRIAFDDIEGLPRDVCKLKSPDNADSFFNTSNYNSIIEF